VEYKPCRVVSLKRHPLFNEAWLQDRIIDQPSILGLGDLDVIDSEVRQPSGGRLDLLLRDADNSVRYEVEIQLGATDPSHIVRTLEYWDIERSRHPNYEHIAVIVAEDITSRFLNVIALFNKAVPIIAVELHALEVEGVVTLHATKVLDLAVRPVDEAEEAGQPSDRDYWLAKASPATLAMVDRMLEIINSIDPGWSLKYNRQYIGLSRNGIADVWVGFRPRRENVRTALRIPQSDEVDAFIEAAGLAALAYNHRWRKYEIRITGEDLARRADAITELIRRANGAGGPDLDEGPL
jgi:hypothetical protein